MKKDTGDTAYPTSREIFGGMTLLVHNLEQLTKIIRSGE